MTLQITTIRKGNAVYLSRKHTSKLKMRAGDRVIVKCTDDCIIIFKSKVITEVENFVYSLDDDMVKLLSLNLRKFKKG
jgi:formylmethanofuran dehydrogenase subunit D